MPDSLPPLTHEEAQAGFWMSREPDPEGDPRWHVVRIRMPMVRTLPPLPYKLAGRDATRRFFRFCTAALAGAGLVTNEQGQDLLLRINVRYVDTL